MYGVVNDIPIVFHDGSNYDYHFIINELAEEFERHFTCFEERIHTLFSYKNW